MFKYLFFLFIPFIFTFTLDYLISHPNNLNKDLVVRLPNEIIITEVHSKPDFKSNSFEINMGLLVFVLLFLFPLKHFLSADIKRDIDNQLADIFRNPYIRVCLCALVVSAFYSGNIHMLSLMLYVIHHVLFHRE